jgi:flagellar basal-body rod modification protein FlgD
MAITALGNSTTPISTITPLINNTATSTNTTKTTNALDKNTFLKLFTEQLKNQDPMNPMDATAFTAQLAQFTALEQQYNTNDNLKTLIASQNSLLASMSANLIGKQVSLNDGSTGKVIGVNFDGTNTNIMLNSNKSVLFTDIKQISA